MAGERWEEGDDDGGMGQTVVFFYLLYASMVKSPVHPSHLFQRGKGGVDLAIHVSASRELRLPLHARIEEVWQIFLTGHVGCAIKQSQWLACTMRGPPSVQSCQYQVIPAIP
jgi:hypothetical protein